MPQILDQAVQNACSDLHAACLTPAFAGKGAPHFCSSRLAILQGVPGPDDDYNIIDIAIPDDIAARSKANRQLPEMHF